MSDGITADPVVALEAAMKRERLELRALLDEAARAPLTSLRGQTLGMDLQVVESRIRLLYHQIALITGRLPGERRRRPRVTPDRRAQPRVVAVLRPALPLLPAPVSCALPLPTVPPHVADEDGLEYEVVWRPHRSAALLSDQFGARCARR
jgi:hypothetical protein